MDEIGRVRLFHEIPPDVCGQPEDEVFFITICCLPRGENQLARPMTRVVASFKEWIAKKSGVHWQRDFFDHRIRSWESAAEKAAYIRLNPVRAGLVANPEDWPYQR